jgi:hypothetical protein
VRARESQSQERSAAKAGSARPLLPASCVCSNHPGKKTAQKNDEPTDLLLRPFEIFKFYYRVLMQRNGQNAIKRIRGDYVRKQNFFLSTDLQKAFDMDYFKTFFYGIWKSPC